MPDQDALHNLLNLQVDEQAPVFIIYSEQASARLDYVCEFIFGHVLKTCFSVTTHLQDWKNSTHLKINYSTVQTEGFQIVPGGLLFEKGVTLKKPVPFIKNGLICFYDSAPVGQATFSFDIFSAVFYLVSRYEEWQPFEKDNHGRFEASASCLYQNSQHHKPVADLWVYELKAALEKNYPALVFPAVNYKAISTIDVDNLYAYRAKGIVRTVGGCLKDLLKFDFKNLATRLQVVSGLKADPFDIYETWARFCLEHKIPLVFFFLFKTGTTYDRTVNPKSPAFKHVFAVLKNNKALAGLHPSYNSAFEKNALKNEVLDFSTQNGEAVTLSRQHFLRFDIKTTPQLLLQQGIVADFSMGFASSTGFRAGTAQPFYYYNFNSEKKDDLLFVPFCAMDGAYFIYSQVDAEAAFKSLCDLAAEVKKVNGLFVTVFHERTFYNHLYPGFGTLYKNLHLKLKDL